MKKLSILLVLAVILPVFSVLSAGAIDFENDLTIESEVAYIASLDNGQCIYDKNGSVPVSPAGLVSVASAMVALNKNIKLDEYFTVPDDVDDVFSGTGVSMLGLDAGEMFTLADLLHFILNISAADAAYTLATGVSGSMEEFVSEMNGFAKSCGCENTVFTNITGLDDDGQHTTAADVWKMSRAAAQNSDFTEIASAKDYEIEKTPEHARYSIQNRCYNIKSGFYHCDAVKWGKTGYTEKAGKCVAAYSIKNGYRYICVVMKAPYRLATETSVEKRDFAQYDCMQLTDWAFDNVKLNTICDSDTVITTLKVRNSNQTTTITVCPASQVRMILPKAVDIDSVMYVIDEKATKNTLYAPVSKGDIVGKADIVYSKEVIATIDLVAGEDAVFGMHGILGAIGRVLFIVILSVIGLAVIAICLHIFGGMTVIRTKEAPHFRFERDEELRDYYRASFRETLTRLRLKIFGSRLVKTVRKKKQPKAGRPQTAGTGTRETRGNNRSGAPGGNSRSSAPRGGDSRSRANGEKTSGAHKPRGEKTPRPDSGGRRPQHQDRGGKKGVTVKKTGRVLTEDDVLPKGVQSIFEKYKNAPDKKYW